MASSARPGGEAPVQNIGHQVLGHQVPAAVTPLPEGATTPTLVNEDTTPIRPHKEPIVPRRLQRNDDVDVPTIDEPRLEP